MLKEIIQKDSSIIRIISIKLKVANEDSTIIWSHQQKRHHL